MWLTKKSGFMEKRGVEPATQGLQGKKKTFCGFPGYKRQVCLRFVCWLYDWNTQRFTVSGFMEKPGIETATSSLHGIGLSLF